MGTLQATGPKTPGNKPSHVSIASVVPARSITVRDESAQSRPTMVAIRLRDWSEWCRQIVRGVQRFAHSKRSWRIYVEADTDDRSRVESGQIQVDGIVSGVLTGAYWKRAVASGSPKVVAFTAAVPSSFSDIPRVQVDDTKVAEGICRHLINGGFRRLAYCATNSAPSVLDARKEGMLAFAEANGFECDLFTWNSPNVKRVPQQALVKWINSLEKPVGIAAWNMDLARRLADACQRANIDIPQDVAIVAWDDDPILAETLTPTISANVLPAERLGYEAARLLDRLLSGEKHPSEPVRIDPSGILHVRQSSDVSQLQDRDVHLALQFIREHATEPLKVSRVASALRVSRRKLEIDLHRVTGKTPNEIITNTRLEHAKQLLLETDWDLQRVAERSGIGTRRTLHRIFLKLEKTTPAEYRAKFQTS